MLWCYLEAHASLDVDMSVTQSETLCSVPQYENADINAALMKHYFWFNPIGPIRPIQLIQSIQLIQPIQPFQPNSRNPPQLTQINQIWQYSTQFNLS